MIENLVMPNTTRELVEVRRTVRGISEMDPKIKELGIVEARYKYKTHGGGEGSNLIRFWHPYSFSMWSNGEASDFDVKVSKRPVQLMAEDYIDGSKWILDNQLLKVVLWQRDQFVGNSWFLVDRVDGFDDRQLVRANQGILPTQTVDPRTFILTPQHLEIGERVRELIVISGLEQNRNLQERVYVHVASREPIRVAKIQALLPYK